MTDLGLASLAGLAARIAAGSLDPVDLTQAMLARAKGVGRPLNAFVHLREAAARAEAEAASRRARTGGLLGPLDGIPIALKDNIAIAGAPITNGLGGPPPIAAVDADVTRRLKRAGAVLLGKLNMHEAALGGTTDNPHHGRTHNPHRIGRSPGGSSGGAGAAVAAGLCTAALGTDTVGSIRLPASYCGVVGLKPSARRVSLRGVAPLSRRLDHVGPLARSVADIGLVMAVLADDWPAWTPAPVHLDLAGMTVCVLDNYGAEQVDQDVARSFERALAVLQGLGARLRRTTLPAFDPAAVRHAMFAMSEAGAALEHGDLFDREPARFSADLARCILYGRRLTGVQLLAQENLVARAADEMLACFAQGQVIASPTTPQPAFSFEQTGLSNLNTFCTLANFTGCPAISLPMGYGPDKLPHGLQLMAAPGRDEALLAIAGAYEAAAGPMPPVPQPFGGP